VKRFSPFLLLWVCLAIPSAIRAATITGTLLDATGAASPDKRITFTPQPGPTDSASGTRWNTSVSVRSVDGVFSVTLAQGQYAVSVDGAFWRLICVPVGSSTYSMHSNTELDCGETGLYLSDTNDLSKVLVSANDTTAAFLATKLIAGANVTLTPSGAGAETLTIAASDIGITNVAFADITGLPGDNEALDAALGALMPASENLTNWSTIATSSKQGASANLTNWSALATSAKQDADDHLTRLAGIGAGAEGDILIRDSVGWTNLAAGIDGKILTLQSGLPAWADAGAAGIWGSITGDLGSQTDLLTELTNKLSLAGGTLAGGLTATTIEATESITAPLLQLVDLTVRDLVVTNGITSAANWTASGTTNSTLAGVARTYAVVATNLVEIDPGNVLLDPSVVIGLDVDVDARISLFSRAQHLAGLAMGIYNNLYTTDTKTGDFMLGIENQVSATYSGDGSDILGIRSGANLAGTGSVSNLFGTTGNVGVSGGTVFRKAIGLASDVSITGGTVAGAYGLYTVLGQTDGTLNNYFGLFVDPTQITGGSTTNVYGLYISALTQGQTNFAIYTAGSTPSYFGGALTIGGNVLPSVSGATDLGSAAVKFRAGYFTGAGTFGGNVQAGVASAIHWNSRSAMYSPTNGHITLVNAAETDFGSLKFGGKTSAYPAIQRNGTGLDVRLADDSNYAPLSAATPAEDDNDNSVATTEWTQKELKESVVTGSERTLAATNDVYLVNVDAQLITLPTAVGASGKVYTVKTITPAETCTITNFTGAQLIDGALSYSLTASNKFVRVVSDNANWWVIGSN